LVQWRKHGWAAFPGLFPEAMVKDALDEAMDEVQPLAGDRTGQFDLMTTFPFQGSALCDLATAPEIGALCADLLECLTPQLYQVQLWAKYGGLTTYEQTHHRDYAKNTMLVPRRSGPPDFLGAFVYLTDVTAESGPPALVSSQLSELLPLEPARYARADAPELYDGEVAASFGAGTLVVYRGDLFHRATEVQPGHRRFVLKLAVKDGRIPWINYYGGLRIGYEPEWSRFFARASTEQLRLLGITCHDEELREALRDRYGREVSR
jgi:hypothetical protein